MKKLRGRDPYARTPVSEKRLRLESLKGLKEAHSPSVRKMPNWIQLLLQEGTMAAEAKNKAGTVLTGAMHRQAARKEAASPFSLQHASLPLVPPTGRANRNPAG